MSRTNEAIRLLFIQASLFGLAAGYLSIGTSTLFIDTYGTARIAYAYIGTGILILTSFYFIGAMERRMASDRVSNRVLTVLCGLLIVFFAGWTFGLPAAVIPLMILEPFLLQFAALTTGKQLGSLFTVKEIRKVFPRVMSGISIGFGVAGASTSLLSGTALGASVLIPISAILIAAIVHRSSILTRAFPETSVRPTPKRITSGPPPPTPRALLGVDLVKLLLFFQVLTTVSVLFVRYVFLGVLEVRYPQPSDFADFLGSFSVVLNVALLSFSFFVAGRITGRGGVRVGLQFASATVLLGLTLSFTVSFWEVLSTLLFWLVVATQMSMIVTQGSINGSTLNTTYQALSNRTRPFAQTFVEGSGVPLAFGATGILLLLIQLIPFINTTALLFIGMLVVGGWLSVARKVFEAYRNSLQEHVATRTFQTDVAVTLDATTRSVLLRMLRSDPPQHAAMAVGLLGQAGMLPQGELVRWLDPADPETCISALSVIPEDSEPMLREHVLSLLDAPIASVAQAAHQAMVRIDTDGYMAWVQAQWDDASAERQRLMATELIRQGGMGGLLFIATHLSRWIQSPIPEDRIRSAAILEGAGIDAYFDPLIALLRDEEDDVRIAALRAATSVRHPKLVDPILYSLDRPLLRSLVGRALRYQGLFVLPRLVSKLEREGTLDEAEIQLLIRSLSTTVDSEITKQLAPFIRYTDLDVRLSILRLLSRQVDTTLLHDEAMVVLIEARDHSLRCTEALACLPHEEPYLAVRRGILHEVDACLELAFLSLACRYNYHQMERALNQLRFGDRRARALVEEMVDVTLDERERTLIRTVITCNLDDAPKAARHTVQTISTLSSIVVDEQLIWSHEFTKSAALYALGLLSSAQVDKPETTSAIRKLVQHEHPMLSETAQWYIDSVIAQ